MEVRDRSHPTYQLVKKFLETGTADVFYAANSARGLIVAPLTDAATNSPYSETSGVQFGEQTLAGGRALFDCSSPLLQSLFGRHKPSDPATGWWTLSDVLGGACWIVRVNSAWLSSTAFQAQVAVGRPVVTYSLVVTRRR